MDESLPMRQPKRELGPAAAADPSLVPRHSEIAAIEQQATHSAVWKLR
jgi:hypothetical protein